jgi:hypothetical protein
MTRRPGVPQPSAAEDGGAATTEMVLVMPVLIMFLFLVVAAGRLTDAKSDVVSAANDAARVASLQGSESAARTQARLAAEDTVAGEGLACQGGIQVGLDFEPGFERGATVHATLTCDVVTGDLALLDLPGVVTVTEHGWEPIDTHRSL